MKPTKPVNNLRSKLRYYFMKRGNRRLADLFENYPWYDWGHPLMALTGSDNGGSWAAPEPETWFYYRLEPSRMIRTGYPIYKMKDLHVIKGYSAYREFEKAIGEREFEAIYWQAIGFDQDGGLILGRRFWGGSFYSLEKDAERKLLAKYLRYVRRFNWYGLRSWLYSQGLHAAVHRKTPFRCNTAPPSGSGGYSHWRCGEKKGHVRSKDPHRYNNYIWWEGDASVTYVGDLYNLPADLA